MATDSSVMSCLTASAVDDSNILSDGNKRADEAFRQHTNKGGNLCSGF